MHNCLECSFHKDKYLIIKNLAPTNIFGAIEVTMNSVVKNAHGFLTRGAEAQLSPEIVLKSIRFVLANPRHERSKSGDRQRSM